MLFTKVIYTFSVDHSGKSLSNGNLWSVDHSDKCEYKITNFYLFLKWHLNKLEKSYFI